MRVLSTILIVAYFSVQLNAQVIYALSSMDEIFRMDVGTCSAELITPLPPLGLTDISFHPNGNMYGISFDGGLFQIDTLTGNVTFLHSLPIEDPELAIFNALTIRFDGTFYASGTHGDLYTYNLETDTNEFLGNFGVNIAGDLTFYEGELYVATISRQILLVNTENPANSSVVINNAPAGENYLYGLSSVNEDCNNGVTYALSNENSRLYRVDWDLNLLSPLCFFSMEFFGSASTSEFLQSLEPLQFASTDITQPSCGLDNGAISVTASGGTGDLTYAMNGEIFQNEILAEDLPPGNYAITVTDENSCTIQQEIQLNNSFFLEIIDLSVENTSCGENNGGITVVTSGGTGSVSFSVDGSNFQTGSTFENLVPDEYTVYAIDESNCIVTSDVSILSSTGLTIVDASTIDSDCGENNGAIILNLQTDSSLDQILVNDQSYPSLETINNLSCGEYLVTITDVNNCSAEEQVTIIQSECPIYIPNVFSPNNDGVNDTFRIYPHPMFKGTLSSLKIFNRWGGLIHESQISSTGHLEWDGNFKGQLLGSGVFVYALEFTTENGDANLIAGDVTLIR
ncbi:T9SS C-terminal target domain-containing protein [Lewinella cohaerens]|uniref:T9SS C-terminal target domain-containing protein n=1 Tax=Lewinella cohaerens TaxID=70995 RepID=UPI00037D4A3C|nr:T9SS C-terminal target domain-containing protein [Lewinella cohaerens]